MFSSFCYFSVYSVYFLNLREPKLLKSESIFGKFGVSPKNPFTNYTAKDGHKTSNNHSMKLYIEKIVKFVNEIIQIMILITETYRYIASCH